MKKLWLIAALMLALTGCNAGEPVQTENPSEAEKAEIIEIDTEYQMKTLSKYEEAVYDFDGDGNDDNILLLTSMKKEGNVFMADDRNQWHLAVITSKGTYPLFDGATSGKLDMSLYVTEDEKSEPVIRLTSKTTSSYDIFEYRYDNGNFVKNNVYTSGVINEMPVTKY